MFRRVLFRSESVARVARGQYRHVARILAGADVAGPATTADHIAGATKFLTVEAGKDPWHRDGWLFQTISWIAAHQNARGAITRAPHALKAHKGLDGMQLEVGAAGKRVVEGKSVAVRVGHGGCRTIKKKKKKIKKR